MAIGAHATYIVSGAISATAIDAGITAVQAVAGTSGSISIQSCNDGRGIAVVGVADKI